MPKNASSSSAATCTGSRRTAPALPPPHLRPCPDATLRELGTLLDHRPLPAAGTAAYPAHHRRDGAPAGKQPGGELHLLQLLRERDTRQHQVPQRPETLHDGEAPNSSPTTWTASSAPRSASSPKASSTRQPSSPPDARTSFPCPPAPRATSRGWTASWSRTSKTSRPSTSP